MKTKLLLTTLPIVDAILAAQQVGATWCRDRQRLSFRRKAIAAPVRVRRQARRPPLLPAFIGVERDFEVEQLPSGV